MAGKTSISGLDSTGSPVSVLAGSDNTGAKAPGHALFDINGVPISSTNPLYIASTSLDGVDASGVTAPTGASGIRGWLSGIYSRLGGTLTVSGTFWQATQPVSASALPLPTGAATAAKQPALGVAGTPSTDVVSVQGISGGTAMVVSGGAAAGATPVNPPVSVAGIDGSGNKQHLLVDTTGRQLVVQAGGTGTDYSANTSAAITAAQTTTLLATIPATATRAYVEVQNQSAATVSLVRDDGAGANQSLILLAGSGAGAQGGGWSSTTFKGRMRVYGASGAQVSAFQE